MTIFKIRNRNTGLYAPKSYWQLWGPVGHSHRSLSQAKAAITRNNRYNTVRQWRRFDLDIITFELKEEQVLVIAADTLS